MLKYMYLCIFLAIRTVLRGHQLVQEGWALFEKTCTDVGVGELSQLPQYLKSATTPTPPTTPVKVEVMKEEEMDVTSVGPSDASVKKEDITTFIEKPIHISLGGKQ